MKVIVKVTRQKPDWLAALIWIAIIGLVVKWLFF